MNTLQDFFHQQLKKTLGQEKNVTKKKPKNTEINSPKKATKIREKKYHRVNCTLSKKEHEQLLKLSKSLKILPTRCFKNLAFSSLEKRKIISPSGEKILCGLVVEIRRIGININQIAKQANTVQKIGFSDLRETHKKLSELEKLLYEAIKYYRK